MHLLVRLLSSSKQLHAYDPPTRATRWWNLSPQTLSCRYLASPRHQRQGWAIPDSEHLLPLLFFATLLCHLSPFLLHITEKKACILFRMNE